MAEMGWGDFVAMIEDTTVRTHMVEYREPSQDDGPGALIACALGGRFGQRPVPRLQLLRSGGRARSLGSFVILDHVEEARRLNLPYVYLGYWVSGSVKMDYKARFRPLEVLRADGWRALEPL